MRSLYPPPASCAYHSRIVATSQSFAFFVIARKTSVSRCVGIFGLPKHCPMKTCLKRKMSLCMKEISCFDSYAILLTIKNVLFETLEQTSISFKWSSSMYGSKSTTASILTGPVPKCISTISIYMYFFFFLCGIRREAQKGNEKLKFHMAASTSCITTIGLRYNRYISLPFFSDEMTHKNGRVGQLRKPNVYFFSRGIEMCIIHFSDHLESPRESFSRKSYKATIRRMMAANDGVPMNCRR